MAESELGQMIKAGFAEYRRIFDYRGRSNRTQFWAFAVINIGLAQVAMAVPMMIGFAQGDPHAVFDYAIGGFLAMLLFAIPYFAAITRRLHDSGRTGWWVLPQAILLGTGLAGFMKIFGALAIDDGLFALMFLNNIIYLGWVALLIFFAVLPGDEGSNRFGDPVAYP